MKESIFQPLQIIKQTMERAYLTTCGASYGQELLLCFF